MSDERPDRTGQVWEVRLYKNMPASVLVFLRFRGNVTSWPRYYETFNLTNGDMQVVAEHAHYPFEKNRYKWSRLG
jgi:hypothetical protein